MAAIVIGAGLALVFLVLQLTVKSMPLYGAVIGFVIGGLLVVGGTVALFLPRRRPLEEIGKDMVSLADELQRFLSDRERGDTTRTPRFHDPRWETWGEDQRRQAFNEYSERMTRYSTETYALYRERFASKVIHLVEEALRRGYRDEELHRYYEHPINSIAMGIVASRIGALGQRLISG